MAGGEIKGSMDLKGIQISYVVLYNNNKLREFKALRLKVSAVLLSPLTLKKKKFVFYAVISHPLSRFLSSSIRFTH